MAGGSTDAAAALVGINRLFDLGFSMEELESARQSLDPERITLIACEGVNASSTDIRSGDFSQVPEIVADYICQRRLYGYEPR